jgi:hypothetical protein
LFGQGIALAANAEGTLCALVGDAVQTLDFE